MSTAGRAQGLVRAYYLSTPLFALADLLGNISIRASFLDQFPALKLLYYLIAFACGLAMTRWPSQAARIGLAESGANIILVVLGVGIAYLQLMDAAEGPGLAPSPFTSATALNLVISAAFATLSYIAAHARLARRR
jgi:hypothetical protein